MVEPFPVKVLLLENPVLWPNSTEEDQIWASFLYLLNVYLWSLGNQVKLRAVTVGKCE
jgi:hypothetical protein